MSIGAGHITVLAGFGIYFTATFILFIIRINKHPIKGRAPDLIRRLWILFPGFFYIVIFYEEYFYKILNFDVHCLVNYMLISCLIIVFGVFIIMRGLWLENIFNKNLIKSMTTNNKEEENKRKQISVTKFVIPILIYGVVSYGFAIILRIDSFEQDCPAALNTIQINTIVPPLAAFMNILNVVVTACVALYISYRIRNIRDSFNIKIEIWICVTIMVLDAILTTIVSITELDFPSTLLFVVMIYTFTITWPVVRTFLYSPEVNTSATALGNLKRALEDPICFDAFREFALREFSVENPMFYQDITAFKNHFMFALNLEEKQKLTMDIYRKYLTPESILQLNIPARVITDVSNIIQSGNITEDIFQQVETAVYRMMNEDTWVRFKRSDRFKDLVFELEQASRHNLL